MRMGFNIERESVADNNILVPTNFTNAICYGQTGSGKTSSFILPNIKNRIALGHTIIVFDYKGNMHLKVKAIAQRLGRLKDVIEIGTLWGKRINVLDGLSEKEIDTLLNASGVNSDYWDMAGRSLFKSLYFSSLELSDLYNFLKDNKIEEHFKLHMFKKQPTFATIYELLKSERIAQYISKIGGVISLIHQLLVKHDTLKDKKKLILAHFEKKLRHFALELGNYQNIKDSDTDSGNKAVMHHLNNTIKDLARISFLNDTNAQKIGALIENKIVVINSENIGKIATQIINARLFSTLKKRAGKSATTPVSIFIDEAHKVITAQSLPETSICRECKFEYIMATQDELLLQRQIGILPTEEMLVNIVYMISFKNINDERCKDLDSFYYVQGKTKGKAEPMFIDVQEEIGVEMMFQKLLNIVRNHTSIEKRGGYLENDPDLFGRDQAYYVDARGHKTIVRLCPLDDKEATINESFLGEAKSSRQYTVETRVDSLESAVATLIRISEKRDTNAKAETLFHKNGHEKRTVKMIVRNTSMETIDIKFFKIKEDAAKLLIKLRPNNEEEYAFFKTILKVATNKDLFAVEPEENNYSEKTFLELPFDLLLYVTEPPVKSETKKVIWPEDIENETKAS